jgi:anti-sigma factor RsiW
MTGPMTTDDRLLLNALADGELDAATALQLERRLAEDPGLAAEYHRILALKDRVIALERPTVTAEFASRISALAPPSPVALRPKRPSFYTGWQALAASVIVTAFLASGLTYLATSGRPGFSIEDEVAGGHRRSLLAASPVDIASSDRHTVKPWLDARLGVSPPATDLAAQGYPLIGGRVDVLGTATVPTLVYRHNEHLITLIAQPGATGSTTPTADFAGGYNLLHWTQSGFTFWAVSDLEPAELKAFAEDYRAAG